LAGENVFSLMTKFAERRAKAAEQLAMATVKEIVYDDMSLVGGPSSSSPALSSHVGISALPGRGRGLTATSPIAMGDTLVVEEAFVAVNSSKGGAHFCHHCLHALPLDWRPCAVCRHPRVRFCSAACIENAHAYHQYECGWMAPLLDEETATGSPPKTSLALRVLLCASPDDMCAFRTSADVPTEYGVRDDEPFGHDFKSMKSLVAHVNVATSFEQVMKILDDRGYFEKWPKNMTLAEKHAVFAQQANALAVSPLLP